MCPVYKAARRAAGMGVMIVGIGSDLCEIERVANAIARHGVRFLDRVFTEQEQALSALRLDSGGFYAGRFAAKEACAKALGTGITDRVRWTDIEILADPQGQPTMVLSGGARRRFSRTLARGGTLRAHVSISYERAHAMACVVLESGTLPD